MAVVGVNIGALTVKAVVLRGGQKSAKVVPHHGRPLEVLDELLAEAEFADASCFGVSGHLGHLTESAAIQRALRELDGNFDAVASLGGESFLVYMLADGRITNVLSHNKCAAGSGEFFVQQIGRMGLTPDEAIRRSFDGEVIPLAARCSVHCKSDITHKLNRNEASVEDILHTLHDSMANKVVSLLQKGQGSVRRVLLIGGVARNAAMTSALQMKLPETEIVVVPESPWFEAWGAALLARDEPLYKTPKISIQQGLGTLPALGQFSDRVKVISAPPQQPPPDGALVLGVDPGSTTTKAVLLDPSTHAVVASHYTRTSGDPVTAARACLRALADQVGNREIGLIATTGSARELVGAYLGTEHVYNEISAHAAGAAHFDPEVDTIFEIGGQDSKYIYLRNGVPIDYAMNNACSAGTGSFLEESARGDLGIDVSDIAEIALSAPEPVLFKATCAAFINSDIRIAQQQGYARDNIVAGLVYAIAGNYLNKVKGARYIGRKVFLQGGVALNHAVGHAFARSVGREVVIPPNPELLGALGVALLALKRSAGALRRTCGLLSLTVPEMKLLGRFTCGACKMYCNIDRFEVAGRRFPFGGRCSLFENVWKGRTRTAPAPDLVQERAELLFATASAQGSERSRRPGAGPELGAGQTAELSPSREAAKRTWQALSAITARIGLHTDAAEVRGKRIGIPRALTTHSLYPLYSTFFSRIGMEVVLSGVDPQGELRSYSSFCFPAQIAHGAVLDLVRQDVRLVFLPHVTRMPQPNPCRDSYLCPITQAGPYFLAKAFPDVRIISPSLDFTDGYERCRSLVETAVCELMIPREVATRAWSEAVRAQAEAERAMRDLGQGALQHVVADGKPAIILAGHSYNAFTPEASQSVGKKLASMGIPVIPADCLVQAEDGPTAWHFANQILNAVGIVKKHPNLFLMCVSNFSCTIDAFTHAMLAHEIGSKPYLILEIDAHTADAGVQTRLEAFLDIIRNYREVAPARHATFRPCQVDSGGQVICSSGEKVPLTDRRVKLYFPNFSDYHSHAVAMAARCLGLHPGKVMPLERHQLDVGLQFASGRECLPLPICIGQLVEIHAQREPGEIAGLYMPAGGAPCVIDAYQGYLERFIAEQQFADLFLFVPTTENDFYGFDETRLAQHMAAVISVADILVEIEHVLCAVGGAAGVEQLRWQWQQFASQITSLDDFHARLPHFVQRLATLPRDRDPLTCPRVVVTGDFFTRFSQFFIQGVRELYAAKGIILMPVALTDLFLYIAYHSVAGTANAWGMKPGYLALAKACTRIFQPDGKEYLQKWVAYQTEKSSDERYRELFRKSGLLVAGSKHVSSLFDKASEHVSPTIFGETITAVGEGLAAESHGYDGIMLIGPFNCLPYRISEAILKPQCILRQMPIISYESDGYAVSPSFLKQVEVHIQQVLEHAQRNRERKDNAGRLAGFLEGAIHKSR